MLFCVSAGFADTESEKGDSWMICPSLETALYGVSGASYGCGFAFGYGNGSSIGIKAVWFLNSNEISVLEFNCLYRFYFFGRHSYSGPFLQFAGGPAFFFGRESGVSIPAKIGAFSIGASFGWRFLIKDSWFIEPSVRGGYPYIAGAGLAAGIRF
jgi:hypothetical protein